MSAPSISNTLRRLAVQLFPDEADQSRFISALTDPVEYATAVVWLQDRPQPSPFQPLPTATWQPDYVDFISFDQRPGRHSLHEAGAFYCLDPSSVFTSQVFSAVREAAFVIDLCASPGGKTVLASRRFFPDRLICNEVIGKRTAALISNLRRCAIANSSVISRDVSRLTDQFPGAADLVIVDAPCSGQSLIARGKKSPGCFHPATMNLNANRQRRILANAVQLVRPGGFLAYITCTYSLKENERNVGWLLKISPELSTCEVPLLAAHRSDYSQHFCYRMWPFDGCGAGGFAALFRREES